MNINSPDLICLKCFKTFNVQIEDTEHLMQKEIAGKFSIMRNKETINCPYCNSKTVRLRIYFDGTNKNIVGNRRVKEYDPS